MIEEVRAGNGLEHTVVAKKLTDLSTVLVRCGLCTKLSSLNVKESLSCTLLNENDLFVDKHVSCVRTVPGNRRITNLEARSILVCFDDLTSLGEVSSYGIHVFRIVSKLFLPGGI